MDISSYILSKQYVEDSLAGAGALVGKSAYQIACDNGFSGSEQDWLKTLVGAAPAIGANGNWFVDGVDTGVIASPSLAGYATEDWVKEQIANITFPKIDLTPYATKQEVKESIEAIDIPEVDLSNYPTKQEVKESIETKIAEIKEELEDLDKEKVLAIAKKKGEQLKDKASELVELAKEKGTPVLEKAANEVRERAVLVTKEVLKKLEEKETK